MSPPTRRPCPGCGREVPFEPVAHEGFWEQKVLARLGMVAFCCSACNERFFRRRKSPGLPAPAQELKDAWPRSSKGPRVVSPEEPYHDPSYHESFDDLIRQLRRAEKWAGLDVPRGQDDRD